MNSTVYAVDEYGNEAEDIRSGYVGEFKKFGFAGIPKHCLACDGSEISRSTYSELFEVFGETYGAGDGETTFNLPDFRGAFLRCIGGNAAALGVEQGDTIRDITGNFQIRPSQNINKLDTAANPLYTTLTGNLNPDAQAGAFSFAQPVDTGTEIGMGFNPIAVSNTNVQLGYQNVSFRASDVVPVAAENRPINYAVNVCVVYE